MIEVQRQNPTYRPFIDQLSITQSIYLPDKAQLEKHFNQAITNFHQGISLAQTLRDLQTAFNQIISLNSA